MTDVPVLWHIRISHYNEKARWALDYKGVAHERRAPREGLHMAYALALTRRPTLPVLQLNGTAIGDSTRIIEALEREYPEPPLYPADPAERRRALELEEFFDEELGPHIRRVGFFHLLQERDEVARYFSRGNAAAERMTRAIYPGFKRVFHARYGTTERSTEEGLRKTRAALDRVEAERGGRDYMVGNSFSVADLALAALVSPIVAPPQFPYPQPQRDHPRLAPLRDVLAESGLLDWARETYARHRPASAEARA